MGELANATVGPVRIRRPNNATGTGAEPPKQIGFLTVSSVEVADALVKGLPQGQRASYSLPMPDAKAQDIYATRVREDPKGAGGRGGYAGEYRGRGGQRGGVAGTRQTPPFLSPNLGKLRDSKSAQC